MLDEGEKEKERVRTETEYREVNYAPSVMKKKKGKYRRDRQFISTIEITPKKKKACIKKNVKNKNSKEEVIEPGKIIAHTTFFKLLFSIFSL